MRGPRPSAQTPDGRRLDARSQRAAALQPFPGSRSQPTRPWPATGEWRADSVASRSAPVSDANASPDLVWVDVGAEGLEAFTPPVHRPTPAGPGLTPHLTDRSPVEPQAETVTRWTPPVSTQSPPPRHDWVRHAVLAALVCAVVAGGVDRLPQFRPPERGRAENEPSRPLVASAVLAGVIPFTAVARPVLPIETLGRPGGVIDPSPPATADADPVPAVLTTASTHGPVALETAPVRVTARAVTRDPSSLVTISTVTAEPLRAAAVSPGADALSGQEPDAQAIERVLGRYRSAFNQLDASAASTVWPSVNERTLARAFDQLEDQVVSFDSCDIQVLDGRAEAACDGSARYVPKVGRRTPREDARQWTFSLRKAADRWLIDRVVAR